MNSNYTNNALATVFTYLFVVGGRPGGEGDEDGQVHGSSEQEDWDSTQILYRVNI